MFYPLAHLLNVTANNFSNLFVMEIKKSKENLKKTSTFFFSSIIKLTPGRQPHDENLNFDLVWSFLSAVISRSSQLVNYHNSLVLIRMWHLQLQPALEKLSVFANF